MSEEIVRVEGLTKHYPPSTKAVDGISFTIDKPKIFSLLGPNGAGKTTTVEILEGLRTPTGGKAWVFGVDVTKDYSPIRSKVGTLPQNFEPFDELKPPEAVGYWAGLFGVNYTAKDIDRMIERVGLTDRKNVISRKLSGGEKRKLGIALSLVNSPDLLFLDEPTTGLDPKARRDLWAMINEVRKDGATVFLTTHYLDEAEKLAEEVAIMHKGKMIAEGTPQDLITKYGKMTVVVLAGAGEFGLKEITRRGISATMEPDGDVLVPVADPAEMRTIFMKLSAIELKIKDMYTRRQSLEDVFLGLVGARMEEGVLRE
jgi:ABC-2 type transport system ATP-binding protein